jgi:hypothetical protein
MKTTILPLLSLTGLLAFGGVAQAKDTGTPEARPAALQVKVELPPSADLFYERDVAEALAQYLGETFERRGFDGRVDDVFYADDVQTERPVLAVNLIRWRRNAAGFVDCTFTAEVRHPDGTTVSLGLFTGSQITWGFGNRWDLRDAFEGAAKNASDQLWSTLVKRDLLTAMLS